MLKTRILTSIVLIPGFLAALFLLPDFYWSLLMLLLIGIGLWEWGAMSRFSHWGKVAYVGTAILAGMAVIVGVGGDILYLQEYAIFWGILVAAVFWLLLAPLWLTTRFNIRNVYLLAIAGWFVILPTWLALVSLRRIDPILLLAIMVAVWIADTAAYFFGKRYGKHKLAPAISPGKTWEVVLGAWFAVTVYGVVLTFSFNLDPWLIVALWGITVLSIIGDLLESLVKRQSEVKDSGTLLPGHGGVLDRIDGLTSSLPLAVFFIYFPLYYDVLMGYV
jgi:phosphatidate cytidylyltransferase